jgi:hypothetical protein
VLLTRSPLGHLPEGRASLDLHVLSTPPAFVLSQDQTLRECFMTTRSPEGPRSVDTESIACAMVDRWSIRADISFARCTKGIVHPACRFTPVYGVDEVLLMALTFGTLLSSQGADAHRWDPFRPSRGQPRKHYSVGFAPSNGCSARFRRPWARDEAALPGVPEAVRLRSPCDFQADRRAEQREH